MFDFDKHIDRKHSDSVKWQKYNDRDILPMWVADMDVPSPPAVMEALKARVSHGIFGYGLPGDDLVESIVAYCHESHGWTISPEWIVWLPGLVTGLNVSCRAMDPPRDTIVTTVPVYPPFLTAPKYSGKQLKTSLLLKEKDSWLIDFDNLAHIIDPTCGLFLLCNPHNPTGRVFTRDELTRLAELLIKKDMTICSDEIHCDLVLENSCRHLPIASLSPEIADRTVTLMAPSKTYNIPGLGCAFAIISNPNLRRRFTRAMAGIVPHVNVLGYTAANAAYRQGGAWLCELLDYLRGNRDMVLSAVNAMKGLKMTQVQATYLAWIDTRELIEKDAHLFFEEAGIGLSAERTSQDPVL